jgi:ribosome-associated heat shock protein Hsp15
MAKVRIDKWLWSVRVYKTRTLAIDACKMGRVRIGDQPVKPSYLLAEGEVVTVRKDGFNLLYRPLQLIEKRVGAAIAAACYEDLTPEEEKNKYNAWFLNEGSPTPEKRERGTGRPTKKARREIDQFKDT